MALEDEQNPNEGGQTEHDAGTEGVGTEGGGRNVDEILDDKSDERKPVSMDDVQKIIDQAVKAKASELEAAYAPLKEENARLKKELSQLKEELVNLKTGSAKDTAESADSVKKILEERDKRLQELEEKLLEERQRRLNMERARSIEEAFQKNLGNLTWATESARRAALEAVSREVVYDDNKGEFIHKTGVPLDKWVSIFVGVDDNQFYFRRKPNRGAGASPSGDGGSKKNIFEMSPEELLEKINAGEIDISA